MPKPFHIVTVCTGNVCRSPFAHLLLEKKLSKVPGIKVSSAGTLALVGQGVNEIMLPECARYGLDPSAFRARKFSSRIGKEADLILTATWEQRQRILEDWPEYAAKIGVITGARSLPEAEPFSLASMRDWVRSQKQRNVTDVPDPYQQGPEVAEDAARIIDENLTLLVQWLTAPGGGGRRRRSA
ncbi:arsenate reductase/protein-tyrosine-phosphatase family protein [Dermabacteraceae bacterium P13147]